MVEELLEVFRLAFSDLAAVSDSDLFEDEVLFSADWLALFAVSEEVPEWALVELLAEPLLVVERLLAPLPTVDVVAPRLVALLLFDELPTDEALPGLVEAAVAAVALEADVSLLVLPLLAEALSVSEFDLTLLDVSEWFDDAASVAASELLLLVVKLSVLVSLLVFERLEERLRVSEELLVLVSLFAWVESSWLFAPRVYPERVAVDALFCVIVLACPRVPVGLPGALLTRCCRIR